MKFRPITISALATMLAAPITVFAFAAGTVPPTRAITASQLIDIAFDFAWPFLMFAVVIMFIIAAFEFFGAGGEASKLATARQHLIWAVVGTAVLFLAFTIPFVVRVALGLGT